MSYRKSQYPDEDKQPRPLSFSGGVTFFIAFLIFIAPLIFQIHPLNQFPGLLYWFLAFPFIWLALWLLLRLLIKAIFRR